MIKQLALTLLLVVGVACGTVQASPIGDTFDLGWAGFIADGGGAFNFEDGEPGEGGGIVGSFTFGTPGVFDLYGNSIVVDSTTESTGPGAEDWVITLTAEDGGPLWDPANPQSFTFMAFRQLSVGTRFFDANGPVGGDGISSPTNLTPISPDYFLDVDVTISDAAGPISARVLFSTTRANGVFIDRNFSSGGSGPGGEIRLLSPAFGDELTGATSIEIRYAVQVAPEPSTVSLLIMTACASCRLRRR